MIGTCWLLVAAVLAGCTGRPNQANIELRKRIQELQSQIDGFERQREADAATIQALQSQRPTVPSLAQERLGELFTTHGIRLGRLTGAYDDHPDRPGDDGIKVYVVPIDQTGDELKAAGSFLVELFDLDRPDDARIGRYEFGVGQAAEQWFGSAFLYEYVLPCPWQNVPRGTSLTLRVTFHDALTGRQFSEQRVVNFQAPTTLPSQPQPQPQPPFVE